MRQQLQEISRRLIQSPLGIAPLITFRILFGGLMMVGAIRFMYQGWIEKLYLEPKFFFKFYGFEWVEPFGETGMYLLLTTIIISSAMVMIGLFYRLAIITFFGSFTYLELIDATNYLNHYYLVCLLAFILIFLPAHRSFSLDVWRNPTLKVSTVPAWTINILLLQLTIVYTCAGIAKCNSDWLFQAMPLSVWLPEHTDLPILGYFFQFKWVAYAFSWAGAFYDLTIAYFLLFKVTRPWAYITVIIFHSLTWLLFNIGLFPVIMIFSTLIFFPAATHERWLRFFGYQNTDGLPYVFSTFAQKLGQVVFSIFILLQLILPFRHWLYQSNVLWTEQGYRFSWRVMLVEKVGYTLFRIEDPQTGRKSEITTSHYLTPFQEKQMSIQPDFILQFAHFIKKEYEKLYGIKNPIITVDAHVALNGRTSRQLIDPQVNLAEISTKRWSQPWVLPFKQTVN